MRNWLAKILRPFLEEMISFKMVEVPEGYIAIIVISEENDQASVLEFAEAVGQVLPKAVITTIPIKEMLVIPNN